MNRPNATGHGPQRPRLHRSCLTPRLLVVLGIAAGSVAACSAMIASQERREALCSFDYECLAGQVCAFGRCVVPGACALGSDCPSGICRQDYTCAPSCTDQVRDGEESDEEAALDGIYVVRTAVPATTLSSEETVRWYKQLATVERAFRSMKTVDIKVRPVGHRKAERVKAHVFQCMLAYYVEWHMRRDLAPILFDDDDKEAGEARRASVVAPAKRSERADQKARTKRTENGDPVHSFQTLLSDLATIAKNRIQPSIEGAPHFDMTTTPTPLQKKALDLLGVSLKL